MSRLSLSLLGTFQANVDDTTVTNFATDKVRALLAFLAMEADRPHRRDTLAALLWPEWDDSSARSNLRLALHRLRETLDTAAPSLSENLFNVTRETVKIHDSAVDVDAARFLNLLEVCETHPHRLLHLCPSCLEQLSEAATIYGGELLAGLSIDDAPAFEQWELIRREDLGRRVLSLLYQLTDAFEQLGNYGRGLLFAHRQLALDPYREEAHRQVIRLYALQGERSAALSHYDRAQRLLADELDVEPDPATRDLIEQIRAGKLSGQNHSGRPQLYHFPARFSSFHGREAEIARLAERLAPPGTGSAEVTQANEETAPGRLFTIVAPGGMGKTRLAIAVAEALSARQGFGDGIYFLSLARLASADLLPSALASALGLNLSGETDPVDQLATNLRSKSLLIILDNFEHLLDGVDLLVRLLEEAPRLKLLVTSREALAVRAEERFVLGGLDDDAAAEVFIAAAARVRPGYDPDVAGTEAIRAISQDVGGMPLALELAATWVRMMDTPAIAARIRADLDFLSTNLRDLPERQRSMRAVFDYMWSTLSAAEQDALARLSVLRGPFRIAAAEAITGASPSVLALLLDQSLLHATGSGRFELHELLRQYAAGKLGTAEAYQATAKRHADYYLGLLVQHSAELGSLTSKEAIAALLRNLDNIRAAWTWATTTGSVADVARAVQPLEKFHRYSGLLADGVEALAAAGAALAARIKDGQIDPAEALPVIYALLRSEAMLLELNGQGEAALERLAQARAGWEALGDRHKLVNVLCDIGYISVRRVQLNDMRPALETALAQAYELEDSSLIASALHNQGNVLQWTGDVARGRVLLEESLIYYEAAGEQHWRAGALSDLGTGYAFEGDIENARAAFRRSLAISEAIGDQPGICMAVTNLGAVALDTGDLAEAEAFTRRGLGGAQDTGDKLLLAVSVGNFGHIALVRHEHAAAMRFYRDTITVSRESGYTHMVIEAVMGLAALAVAEGQTREAGAATRWMAAIAARRLALGYSLQTPFIENLDSETETQLRQTLGERFGAFWAEGLELSLELAADEAAAWAVGRGYSV